MAWMVRRVMDRKSRRRTKTTRNRCLVITSVIISICVAYSLAAAIDVLTLDYNVKFPLSLVISRKTILRYQLIFRFLLHLKHVESSLSAMWIEHKTLPWRRNTRPRSTSTSRPASRASTPHPPPKDWHTDFDNWRKRVFLLRARMLAFVQQILAFATFEVLEPNWRKLESKLEAGKVETVDQLLRDHVDFLDTCLKECMLTSDKLLKVSYALLHPRSTVSYISLRPALDYFLLARPSFCIHRPSQSMPTKLSQHQIRRRQTKLWRRVGISLASSKRTSITGTLATSFVMPSYRLIFCAC